jgi:hypothetical protein
MSRLFSGLTVSALILIGSASGAEQGTDSVRAQASCRTYASAYRVVTASMGITSTTNGTCTFNNSTVEGTCVNRYTDASGQSFTTTSVTTHATRGDVVDEVQVVPPRLLARGTTTTITGPNRSTTTATNTYDNQRRLLTTTAVESASGRRTTTTYTAWDRAGRPTAGSSVIVGGSTSHFTHTYDDAARTQTSTASGVTCTNTYDANGINRSGTCAGGSSTTTFTTLSTSQVCR